MSINGNYYNHPFDIMDTIIIWSLTVKLCANYFIDCDRELLSLKIPYERENNIITKHYITICVNKYNMASSRL